MCFRIGPEDTAVLAGGFRPTFGVDDLLNLPNRSFYLKLMINGAPSRSLSAEVASSGVHAKLALSAQRDADAKRDADANWHHT